MYGSPVAFHFMTKLNRSLHANTLNDVRSTVPHKAQQTSVPAVVASIQPPGGAKHPVLSWSHGAWSLFLHRQRTTHVEYTNGWDQSESLLCHATQPRPDLLYRLLELIYPQRERIHFQKVCLVFDGEHPECDPLSVFAIKNRKPRLLDRMSARNSLSILLTKASDSFFFSHCLCLKLTAKWVTVSHFIVEK